MNLRSKHGYETLLYDFIKEVLVVCPVCNAQAIVLGNGLRQDGDSYIETRITCSSCGYNKYWKETNTNDRRGMIVGAPIDPYFHLPLWLQIPVGENTLWAYNYDHLRFLKEHIGANLRERNDLPLLNRSIASRLPKWMTSKKNRATVIQSIERLTEQSK
ncbi:MAG: hypothetical protein AAFX87_20950 [Bacteroidota bacterium]